MRGFRLGGVLSGALAAVSLGLLAPAPAPMDFARPERRQGRSRRTSGQVGDRDRLVVDRSSNIAKMKRWVRNGTLELTQPDQRALMRHSWYRRQKEKEARAGAIEAWQEAAQ